MKLSACHRRFAVLAAKRKAEFPFRFSISNLRIAISNRRFATLAALLQGWPGPKVVYQRREMLQRLRMESTLQENGVESRPGFYPIHLMPPYAAGQRFPVAESIARRGISLPSSASLSDSEIEKVCAVLKRCLEAIR